VANELQVRHSQTGRTVKFLLWNATAQLWNGTAFVAYATANLAASAIVATEQGTASRRYVATMPAVPAGVYYAEAFDQAGAGLAETDQFLGAETVHWTGTAVLALGMVLPANAAVGAANGLLRLGSNTTGPGGLYLSNGTGPALSVESGAGDAVGFHGGGTGHGLRLTGGSSDGSGLYVEGHPGATGATAAKFLGSGSAAQLGQGDGLEVRGAGSAQGLSLYGGPIGGDAFYCKAIGGGTAILAWSQGGTGIEAQSDNKCIQLWGGQGQISANLFGRVVGQGAGGEPFLGPGVQAELAAGADDAVADAVLARSVAAVEASCPEHCLATVILGSLESSRSGNNWVIRRSDGATVHATKSLIVDPAAQPVTAVS
jgi:hypothetical protein